jgi:hypothetical protein
VFLLQNGKVTSGVILYLHMKMFTMDLEEYLKEHIHKEGSDSRQVPLEPLLRALAKVRGWGRH